MAQQVNPTLMIGLGGTGSNSIFETKKSLLRRYGKIPPCIKLVVFDTDIGSLEQTSDMVWYKKPEDKSAKKHEVRFDSDEMFRIPIVNPASSKKQNHIKSWLSNIIEPLIVESNNGARQMRQVGRFSFYQNYASKNIKGKLEQMVAKINQHTLAGDVEWEIVGDPQIHMVFSPCGGTGGGTFLDFAMTMKNLAGTIKNTAWLVMPSYYEHFPACTRVHQNAYASLKEIDHLMGMGDPPYKWSNNTKEDQYTVNYTGRKPADDLTLNALPLFSKVYLFDNVMFNGKGIGHVSEAYKRIGDILYEMVSGAGDQVFGLIESNMESDTNEPTNEESGSKRRNYYGIGIGHLSFKKIILKELSKHTLMDKMLDRQSAGNIDVHEEVKTYLAANQLQERGDGENDDIIDSIFQPTDLKYSPDSLLPGEFKAGCREELQQNCSTLFNRKSAEIKEACQTNMDAKEKAFHTSLNDHLKIIFSQGGGISEARNFLGGVEGEFNAVKLEMQQEAESRKQQVKNMKSSKADQLKVIKSQENSYNPFGKDKKIKEECERYGAIVSQELTQTMEIERREKANQLLNKFTNHIKETTSQLGHKEDMMRSARTRLHEELSDLRKQAEAKAPYDKSLTLQASEWFAKTNFTEEELDKLLHEFDMSTFLLSDQKDLLVAMSNYLDDAELIQSIEDLTLEKILAELRNLDNGLQEEKNALKYLSESSSPCVNIDTSFCANTNVPAMNSIKCATVRDSEETDFHKYNTHFSAENQVETIISNHDSERITMIQATGPFPANSLSTMKESKTKFAGDSFFFHVDTELSDKCQDLFKDDSIHDALVYFGLGSVLGLIKCDANKYTIHVKGEDIPLAETMSSKNKKDRDSAFAYFKTCAEYVDLVKDVYEKKKQSDPQSVKRSFVKHFDELDSSFLKANRTVLKKMYSSLSDEEKSHCRKERIAVAQFGVEIGLVNFSDYQFRKDPETGETKEKYPTDTLSNCGVIFE